MKTGLGLYQRYRKLYAYLNLLRFGMRKTFLGFDVANLFLQRVDKYSLRLILSKHGARIGRNCDIETGQVFHNCKNYSNLIIGENCHIGKNCFFDLREKIIIGDNVVISMKCTFLTHIDMSKSSLSSQYPSESKQIEICSDVYIGANSTILMGVTLGNNCIVAATSMIKKTVDSNTLVAGSPAHRIRSLINGK